MTMTQNGEVQVVLDRDEEGYAHNVGGIRALLGKTLLRGGLHSVSPDFLVWLTFALVERVGEEPDKEDPEIYAETVRDLIASDMMAVEAFGADLPREARAKAALEFFDRFFDVVDDEPEVAEPETKATAKKRK